MAWLEGVVNLIWQMLISSALMLIFGFFLAGLIRSLLPPDKLSVLFGSKSTTQLFSASFIGIPLPLCSCSVLPVAGQLRNSGLSRPGTVSFLISTPETGVDSIALSWRLLGPFFSLIRPVAALLIALFSGLMTMIFIPEEDRIQMAPDRASQKEKKEKKEEKEKKGSLFDRLIEGQRFIIKDFLPEMAYYLFWGFLLAGIIGSLIPEGGPVSEINPFVQYAVIILFSLPIYVCATSSTPLAAVFLAVGILPGAVLTFLLVGPATNITALVVQKKILGLKTLIVMTASIVVGAIGCGLLLDQFFSGQISAASFMSPSMNGMETSHADAPAWYDFISAVILAVGMVYFTIRHIIKKIFRKKECATDECQSC